MKNLTSITFGLIGLATPIITTATQIDYSNPSNTGLCLALSTSLGIVTGIAGTHFGNKLERKLFQQQ